MGTVQCGTYAGYQTHHRLGQGPCEHCREAARQYMRDYRARRGPGMDRWWTSTRNRALEQLATEHPRRFAEILACIRAGSETPWDPEP